MKVKLRPFEKYLFMVMVALVILDGVTTYICLEVLGLPVGYESNPIIRCIYLTGNIEWLFIYYIMAVCTFFTFSILPYLIKRSSYKWMTIIVIVSIYILVVANNMVVIFLHVF